MTLAENERGVVGSASGIDPESKPAGAGRSYSVMFSLNLLGG